MRADLTRIEETIYELLRDLSMMHTDAKAKLDAIPEESEEYEYAAEIVEALEDAIEHLEDATDGIQRANG